VPFLLFVTVDVVVLVTEVFGFWKLPAPRDQWDSFSELMARNTMFPRLCDRKRPSSIVDADQIESGLRQYLEGCSFCLFSKQDFDQGRNYRFLLKGSLGKKTVLIVAHIDSVPAGPGATDDCVGSVVLFELLRVLALSGKQPLHNILVHWTDAEEVGLRGSSAYIRLVNSKGESLDDIFLLPDVVINIEGSGTARREVLLRSNSPWLVKKYADAAPRPVMHSIAEFIFNTLQIGSTDFDVYGRCGSHGIDLIFTDERFIYHTSRDIVEKVHLARCNTVERTCLRWFEL
jgi:hypothetical protein